MISRRQLFQGSSAWTCLTAAGLGRADPLFQAATLDNTDLGVSSGDPTDTSVTLWTRIPKYGRDPLSLGSQVSVGWDVASNPDFNDSSIVQSGTVTTGFERDFTVNVRVGALEANSVYYYRFRTQYGFTSQIGRTKTFPSVGAAKNECRFAVVCCLMHSAGLFTSFSHIAAQSFDVILHLGDTIYAHDRGKFRPKEDPLEGREADSLTTYRIKHQHYLTDPDLQAARRSAPWIFIWDDHEVMNDYSGPELAAANNERLQGGYHAYSEYMPIQLQEGGLNTPFHVQMYRKLQYGNLITFLCLDGRQYRSGAACGRSVMAPGCDNVSNPGRSMLGAEQKKWLEDSFVTSKTRWRFLLSDMVFSPLRANLFGKQSPTESQQAGMRALREHAARNELPTKHFTENKAGAWLTLDGWDGFTYERNQIMRHITDNGVSNIVIFSGDIHASLYSQVTTDSGQFAAYEIVVPSITASSVADYVGPLSLGLGAMFKHYNPNIEWQNHNAHGYVAGIANDEQVTIHFYEVPVEKHGAKAKLMHATEINARA